jgi:hypothetical protein
MTKTLGTPGTGGEGHKYRTSKKAPLVGVEPRVNGNDYAGRFLDGLNAAFPVRAVLGKAMEHLAEEDTAAVYTGVCRTLGNLDWEFELFGKLLGAAAKGDAWRAIQVGQGSENEKRRDLDRVEEKGLGYAVVHGGSIFLLPSQKLLEHFRHKYVHK